MSNAARNPDGRRLPPGWIEQYERNYDAWFYVDTNVTPPVTSWTHPASFQPPPGPPPGGPQYGGGYGQPPPQNYPPQQYGGYNQPGYNQGGGYNQPPAYGGYGGPQQGYGGSSPGRGYGSGYQEPVYEPTIPPKKPGMSNGAKVALGAGAGLLGGLAIADVFEHEENKGFDQGYEDRAQQDNNYDGGGGYDGGGNDGGGGYDGGDGGDGNW